MNRSLHPFPARMAPELAINSLAKLSRESVVLDPMVGSGTVLREASRLGHSSIGFDLDPLAVLITSVSTSNVKSSTVETLLEQVIQGSERGKGETKLPWVDNETDAFIDYWFGESQRTDLTHIARQLYKIQRDSKTIATRKALDVLKLSLSRIIVTKNEGASLARDVSHSRPHRVKTKSDFNVLAAFRLSVNQVLRSLSNQSLDGKVRVKSGDARLLTSVSDESIDMLLTSPPYLNAIDYMRGHRLSLVWLGYSLSKLRSIRSNSIGAERSIEASKLERNSGLIKQAMGDVSGLPQRYNAMIHRYSNDILRMMSEVGRVLKPSGDAVFVIGDSCIKGVYVRNSEALIKAAELSGLALISKHERQLPTQSRYLPIPKTSSTSLGKRMRSEIILQFRRGRE